MDRVLTVRRPRLTEISYIVLGMLEETEPATPYDLEQFLKVSTASFWPVSHTQVYAECARLSEAGLAEERREKTGRWRRFYTLTPAGRTALENWRTDISGPLCEIRDVAAVKIFFGADPERLAAEQVDAHRRRLGEYEQLLARLDAGSDRRRLALQLRVDCEREFLRFWSTLLPAV